MLETNLREVATLSVGRVVLDRMTLAYYARQRRTADNDGRSIYGGSDLVCVRGDWGTLDRLPMTAESRLAITQAVSYDAATTEYPGFMASRRNYDIGQ